MRDCQIWRDEFNVVYARDSKTSQEFRFNDYAGAATDVKAVQVMVAQSFMRDLNTFLKWLDGENLPVGHGITILPQDAA